MPPPANNPSEPPAPSATSPYLQQLEAISSPVPDFAATLTSHPEDDANDDNVNFLRNPVYPSSDPPQGRARRRRQPYTPEDDWDHHMEPSDRRNIRLSAISRRMPIVRRQREEPNPSNVADYETHIPHAQSLYGWAPISDNEDDRPPDSQADFLQDLWYGRIPNRDPTRAGNSTRGSRREVINGPPPFAGEMADGGEGVPGAAFRYGESSLTTAALLQSVRRHPRFSSRSRTLQNYILDRERSGQDPDERERERPTPTSRAHRPRGGEHYRSHAELQARIDAQRQLYLENPSVKRVKEIIKYLERIRFSRSYELSLSLAAAGGLIEYDGFNRNEHDFVLDTTSIGPPAECSWLQPGIVFSGSQQAGHSPANPMLGHRVTNMHRTNDPVIVNGSDTGRLSVYTGSGRRYWANNIPSGPVSRGNESGGDGGAKEDVWPVRVTIHDIDYENMTLSGTMEAYNIPDKTSTSQDAHIVTFLEGEIIDFNTHTLETKSFKADAEVDSTYWRELQPFKNLTDDELVKNLVSKQWLTEELAKGWILMRWKERCFITPTDSRQGLTISGFYYISLRRDNGQIDGLYYDPGSSPYQQLSLKPELKEQMVFPAYEFR
ncbi:hypothetical protein FQN54_003627 [Arachnomyces sp. PD_36]|nr:hypothetical protein FQN54_003627 [Arachnomyces sp. PD_36]